MDTSNESPRTGVIITGGASGIGLACGAALVAAGRPVALWDIGEGRAAAAADELRVAGVAVAGLEVDVRDHDLVLAAIERTRAELGSIGALVHAAGTIIPDPIDQVAWDDWDSQLDVHLRSYARLVQSLLADLRRHAGAAVVGISSINGILGNAANPAYCAAKAGMLGLNRSMAARLGPEGIRVNGVCPGYIITPMMQAALDRGGEAPFAAQTSLGRMGRPEEIGRVVRFLLGDDASYITGQTIAVDGGVTTTV